jgi:hypothetical protein
MKVLSFDPGKNNWAYALLNEKGNVLRYGMVKGLLKNLIGPGFHGSAHRFKNHLEKFFQTIDLEPTDIICAERYQYRPHMGGGAVTEFINIQLGIVSVIAPCPMRLYIPAQWKTHMARTHGGVVEPINGKIAGKPAKRAKFEAQCLLDPEQTIKLSTHESDAICIGLYHLEQTQKDISPEKLFTNVKRSF